MLQFLLIDIYLRPITFTPSQVFFSYQYYGLYRCRIISDLLKCILHIFFLLKICFMWKFYYCVYPLVCYFIYCEFIISGHYKHLRNYSCFIVSPVGHDPVTRLNEWILTDRWSVLTYNSFSKEQWCNYVDMSMSHPQLRHKGVLNRSDFTPIAD